MFNTMKKASKKTLALCAVATALVAGVPLVWTYGVAAATPPNIPAVNISPIPLYAGTTGDKPALALALSVEFPTVGAQYLPQTTSSTDNSYLPTNEYLGYYNSEMCYTYNDRPTESPATGKTAADYKRFVISGPATNRQCSDAFSGNFLNWSSNSAIDMLRVALSGGDRYIDETGLTVLQRAVLPNGDPICMWNSNNFPAKQLAKGNDGKFMGAVPQQMIAAANKGNASSIWVGNTLNRIYFGLSKTGNCSDTSAYNLTGPQIGIGPIASGTSLPADATYCADENGSCTANGAQEIWYGANNKWYHAPALGPVACSNSVFGDPIVGTEKKCYMAEYNGSWTPSGNGVLNTDGFFYARAEVCGRNSDGSLKDQRDYHFCTKYPSGNFKPVGTIQRYSDQLRLAAFGYAMSQVKSGQGGLYGGVLRAPMKFVGPRTYNTSGVENTPVTGNPTAEWDSTTGVFAANPDSDTSVSPGISGVINYLNKFGRTGPVPGRYKQYDPASELYGETLRYLQGLGPTSYAVDGITTQMKDGFPIYTDWKDIDPYKDRSNTADYSCLKSNIALIGDINTWDSKHNGNNLMPSADVANNIPDVEQWINVVKGFERGTSVSYVDGQGTAQVTSNPNTLNGSPNTRGDQLYGLAYWAHTHDIRGTQWTANAAKQRPGLRVKSFFFDVNEFSGSNNASSRQKNNQYFTAAKYGGFANQPTSSTTQPYNIHGKPFYDKDGNTNNNVWQDPNNVGEAQTYFLQSNARGVLSAFDKIFSDAASAQRSIAGATASSGNLTSTGSLMFQASFDTGTWTGDVEAFKISAASDGSVTMASTATWSAEQQLATEFAANGANRNIWVGRRGPNPTSSATEFKSGTIEAALQTDLDRLGATGASDGLWSDRVDYLRGDKRKEGSPFRRRFRALGDVVNSGVQYVGVPSANSGLGEGHGSFASANATRKPTVYAGANDGMLHAFNASTGKEFFAYIPSWMGPKLSALTDVNYVKQAYVDATPVIGDAKLGSGTTATDWRSVLVGGTGGGGKGVYALDVTDPTAFTGSKVLWEFTQNDDADMGYVLGKPRIVKLQTNVGAPGATAPAYRWFAMVPSGVNNYVPQSDGIFSASGKPTIFLLALDKAAGTAWALGTNYYKLSLPFNATVGSTYATGIINVEAFMNSAGVTQYVYGGDLHGQFWSLDFTKFGTSGWSSEKLSTFTTSSTAFPMFVAKDSKGKIQPITAAPAIFPGADSTQHFVGFGTGKYIEPSDATSTQSNSYYALYDNGSGATTSGIASTVGINGRGRLAVVQKDTSDKLAPTNAVIWGRPTSDADTSQRAGWYYDFSTAGERVIYDSSYVPLSTTVAFSSLVPSASSTPGVCGVAGGSGNTYYVDLLSGVGRSYSSRVGVLGQPAVFSNDEATTETAADSTGRRLRKVPVVVAEVGADGIAANTGQTNTYAFGRLSWRQINDYLELKNK